MKYRIFGIFTLLFSLFFMFVVSEGSVRILFISGILYSFVLFFHNQLERLFTSWTTHPLRAYAIGVVVNGLIVETLAYTSQLDRIRAGEQVFLFATSSLTADLLLSLPYYLAYAWIFAWAVRKYDFSPLSLGVTIFIAQAVMVDVFTHFIQLFSGNILGFLQGGMLMLFTLHGSIILFSSMIKQQYPNRSRSWVRYPILGVLQLVPLPLPLIIVFIKTYIL
jgi:hypothetical protein